MEVFFQIISTSSQLFFRFFCQNRVWFCLKVWKLAVIKQNIKNSLNALFFFWRKPFIPCWRTLPSPPNKILKGHFTGIFENFVSSFTYNFNFNLAFWLSIKISQKPEMEMILHDGFYHYTRGIWIKHWQPVLFFC